MSLTVHTHAPVRGLLAAALLIACAAGRPGAASGQLVLTQAERTVQVEQGKSALLLLEQTISRFSLTDSTIANVFFPTEREVVINAFRVGTTSMLIWDALGRARMFTIEVIPDITALQTQLRTLFTGTDVQVTTTGNSLIVSGAIRDPSIVRRVLQLAQATGATVINNIQAPSAEQILLHVRFAEVRRSALEQLGANLFATNVANLGDVVGNGSRAMVETLSEGIVSLFLSGRDADLEAVIRALRASGDFRSLAEPNLIALEGQEATFLAGGEFPFPTIQSGAQQGAVTIVFKEFGVRLSFTPTVTNSGAIRLRVAPEVSSLDFANALTISGFQIPSLLTRRAETEVELMPGQHLAIAGLLDNAMLHSVDKIPFLGDLPILGALFRSTRNQQNRTELLVLVTPYLVEPSDTAPAVPGGEPAGWRWERHMRMHPDSAGRTSPNQTRRPGGRTP